jgi:predicted metalloprotease
MEFSSTSDLFGSSTTISRIESYFKTRLEKRLFALLVFFIVVTLILLISVIIVASTKRQPIQEQQQQQPVNVCETEACQDISKEMFSFVDTSADPCDDFYESTCGKWIKSYDLPDTSLESGPIALSQQKINQQIRGKSRCLYCGYRVCT